MSYEKRSKMDTPLITNECFRCCQVREALRRSRVESRDLRASLFRAEDVIKQLTLTKAARRRGAHHSSAAQQRDASSPLSSPAAAFAATAANEKERRLVSYLLAFGSSGGGGAGEQGVGGRGEGGGASTNSHPNSSSSNSNCACPVGSSRASADSDSSRTMMLSRESLLTRVQHLERELRLAEFRNASEAAGHGRRVSAEEVRPSTYGIKLTSICIPFAVSKDTRPFDLNCLWRGRSYTFWRKLNILKYTLGHVHDQNVLDPFVNVLRPSYSGRCRR